GWRPPSARHQYVTARRSRLVYANWATHLARASSTRQESGIARARVPRLGTVQLGGGRRELGRVVASGAEAGLAPARDGACDDRAAALKSAPDRGGAREPGREAWQPLVDGIASTILALVALAPTHHVSTDKLGAGSEEPGRDLRRTLG